MLFQEALEHSFAGSLRMTDALNFFSDTHSGEWERVYFCNFRTGDCRGLRVVMEYEEKREQRKTPLVVGRETLCL